MAVHTRLVARHGSASSRAGMIFSTSHVTSELRLVKSVSGSVAAQRNAGKHSSRAILTCSGYVSASTASMPNSFLRQSISVDPIIAGLAHSRPISMGRESCMTSREARCRRKCRSAARAGKYPCRSICGEPSHRLCRAHTSPVQGAVLRWRRCRMRCRLPGGTHVRGATRIRRGGDSCSTNTGLRSFACPAKRRTRGSGSCARAALTRRRVTPASSERSRPRTPTLASRPSRSAAGNAGVELGCVPPAV